MSSPTPPPVSKDSEMMVLGCMLNSINSLNTAAELLTEGDFYFPEHKTIFQVMKDAYLQDKPCDLHLTCEELKRREKLENVGGVGYITTLSQFAGTGSLIEEYARVVRDMSTLRRMVQAAQKIEHDALKNPKDVPAALDEAQQILFRISQAASTSNGITIQKLLSGSVANKPFLKELEERQETYATKGPEEAGITGLPSSFKDLDLMINGLCKSNLIIIAGRPAMGKTAIAVNIAESVCIKQNVPVGIFSLEMSADQLLHRMICSHSEVESDRIRTGSLSGIEYQRIVGSVNEMQKHTMVIDDQPGLKISDIRARARRMKEAHNIGLLVIDYLQLISGSNMESRQNEVSEISRNLKTMARELDIPIICPCQLSRKVEDRTGHRPMLSDLRESGSIEQDADIVLLLLRRDYYDPLDKPGMAEVIVAKNRHGAVGSVNLTYRKEIARFENYTPVHVDEEAAMDAEQEAAFQAFTPDS